GCPLARPEGHRLRRYHRGLARRASPHRREVGSEPLLTECECECECEESQTAFVPHLLTHTHTRTHTMGLLDTEPGKRRLLSVEVPAIEAYNDGRDPEYRITLTRAGGALVLSYCLKPCHNVYRLETRLLSSYPVVPPETRI